MHANGWTDVKGKDKWAGRQARCRAAFKLANKQMLKKMYRKLYKVREERQEMQNVRAVRQADRFGRRAWRCANMQASGWADTQTNKEASKL